MSTNEESSGSKCSPHVESSDSEQPNAKSEIESSNEDEDMEDVEDINNEYASEFTCSIDALGVAAPIRANLSICVMSFVEEHNHPLVYGASRMFLRCNRNLSVVNQHFIMDCSRASVGATKSHALVKELYGSYEDIGAIVNDFNNFLRDVKVRIGDHDAAMILAKFKLKKEMSNNIFYYDYKVDKKGHLTGLFWTDAIGQANFDVFGDIVLFDPTYRTNRDRAVMA
ncbi:hypothetical protein POM88_030894 [Heracleum sosnowskyi]|uniref:Protein FAR1-RELATED SEQUENCE n=1 Tax=Heracleum sosnowskyi TaxID=360622 RepID=A0AAD8MIL0_9APIA|nr:hypothetical protein POM88_030894 [Heracleum sosnowskyi]